MICVSLMSVGCPFEMTKICQAVPEKQIECERIRNIHTKTEIQFFENFTKVTPNKRLYKLVLRQT